MSQRCLLSWSSGKDSAFALWVLRQDPAIEVVGLVTTINSEAGLPCTPCVTSCSACRRRR